MKIDATLLKGLVILLFAWFVFRSYAQEKLQKVTFLLSSPDLADTSSVFICGIVEDLASSNPSKTRMENIGNHIWTKEIFVPKLSSIEYKYTLGSWERKGCDANGNPLQNFAIHVLRDNIGK